MADWYVSSAAYSAIPAFQASHAYVIGDIIVPTAPALRAKWVFRCTTAGTSSTEPTWTTGNNSTIASGGATFTNVTGQSTYFWAAAAGDIPTLIGAVGTARVVLGDRVFVSSDHSETQTASMTYGANVSSAYGLVQYLCVNRAGSTPPVAADLTTGAQVICSNQILFEATCNHYHYGITYSITAASSFIFCSSGTKTAYFKNCQLYLNTSNASSQLRTGDPANLVLDNSTLRFGNAGQSVTSSTYPFNIRWLNTSSALAGATFPTALFQGSSTGGLLVVARGVDLSALTGTLVQGNYNGAYLFDSCKIASAVTRYGTSGIANTAEQVDLVNCFDSTNILSEAYSPFGAVTTEFTITLSGGAADDVSIYSHKMVSNANVDKFVNQLNGFWMDVENTVTGSSKTATVEIISSASLNNDEIALYLQYEGTSSSSVASFGDSFIATALTTATAVTTSTATWNSSPATPVKQKLQVVFTPQHAGRIRGQVRLGKASTTCYVDPRIVVT